MTTRFRVTAPLIVAILWTALAAPRGLIAQNATARRVDLDEVSLGDLQRRMTAGELTSRAIVDEYLARIEATDRSGPALRSFIAQRNLPPIQLTPCFRPAVSHTSPVTRSLMMNGFYCGCRTECSSAARKGSAGLQ